MKRFYKNLLLAITIISTPFTYASPTQTSFHCKVLEQKITLLDNGAVTKTKSYMGAPKNGDEITWVLSVTNESSPSFSIKVLYDDNKETLFHYLYPLKSGEKFSSKYEYLSHGSLLRILTISDMYVKKLTLGDTFINNRSNAAGSFNFHLQRFLHGDWGGMISTPPQNVNYPNVIESWTLNFRCEETVREISRLKDQIYDLVKSDLNGR